MFGSKKSPLVADLRAVGIEGRVLAQAEGPAGHAVIALEDQLALRDGDGWTAVGWHLLKGGGWKKDTQTLRWSTNAGEGGEVHLDDPGRVPEVFNERVMASIVVQQNYDAPGGGRVMIAGRRRLGPGAHGEKVVWQAVTSGSASLADPAVADFVIARTAELRADYTSEV